MALNIHFDCEGPEGWHVLARRAQKSVFDDWRLHACIAKQPVWISTHLYDLISSGQIRLAKQLPRPQEYLIKRKDWPDFNQLKPQRKRQRIAELAQVVYEPNELPSTFWAKLGVNVLSLPSYLRPGIKAR